MTVSTDITDGVALITMDDGKANAINDGVLDALDDALSRAEKEARAVVLAGRPGCFSAGFDLNVMRRSMEDAMALVNRGGESLIRLLTFPRPVVAACTGHAIAMGVFMLLACDRRIGADGAFKLGANETQNNMRLPVFGIELSRTVLDPRHHIRVAVHAELFAPNVAGEIGILDDVVVADAVISTAQEIAAALGALPADAYLYNKLEIRKPTIDAIRSSLQN